MSETGQIFDQETIGAGGSASSGKFTKSSSDGLTLQLVGDGNSTNIDVVVLSKANSAVPDYGEYVSSQKNVDLTQFTNNSKLFPIDVNEIAEFEIRIDNNSGSSTDIDAYYRFK